MENKTHDLIDEILHDLKHYLPAQAPLKDFVHHNTLHAFQELSFFDALQKSNEVFGYKTSLSILEYKALHENGKIPMTVIDWVLKNEKSIIPLDDRKRLLLETKDNPEYKKRIGKLRVVWKNKLHIDLNTLVHLNLFKLVGSYLDQGISSNHFPNDKKGLLNAISELEQNTFFEFFHSQRVKDLLFKKSRKIEDLLKIVVGDESYYQQYLFDQQFAHPGWSGMVAVIESKPETLHEKKFINFEDFVYLELLLEIDALDKIYGVNKWQPISKLTNQAPIDILSGSEFNVEWEVKKWWQQCFEFSFYDQVLLGLKEKATSVKSLDKTPTFQGLFCIDDREESLRRHIELIDDNCQTLGTPAHFNLPIFYRPSGGKFNTQVCPGGISPKHVIIDASTSRKKKKDLHFHKSSHNFLTGWMISQTLGFWSALKLFINIFKPTISPGHSSSFEHMSHKSELVIENVNGEEKYGLQIGFTSYEMKKIVINELQKTGLTKNFAPIVYLFGHGGSSTNNPYYAGYNCGACSGRPSSLNSRVFALMANRQDVRTYLKENGIYVPETTQFLGGLHDTTRDEIAYYDEHLLSQENQDRHINNKIVFKKALANNAKERARQFISIDTRKAAKEVHKEVRKRSVALFEPRPELNHSNNCLCIVGDRKLTKKLFLDQRAFLSSYDWKSDASGQLLVTILNAATPVCGGINLEYFFSRVDNENFGAGSKLPHNVVGLFGVANGIEGDLRTGLPIQMVEVHDPLRLLMIVEQKPAIVRSVLDQNPATKEWYMNGWVNLAIIEPDSHEILIFKNGEFVSYTPIKVQLEKVKDMESIFETETENLPVLNLI